MLIYNLKLITPLHKQFHDYLGLECAEHAPVMEIWIQVLVIPASTASPRLKIIQFVVD